MKNGEQGKAGDGFLRASVGGGSPKCHCVKTSKTAPRESHGREQGRGRAEIREPRGLAGVQDESRKPVSRDTLPPATGCRADGCRPRVSQAGKGLQKGSRILYAEILQIERKSRPKPRFSPLSTLPGISLRQEIFVFAARKKFLSAKKSCFCRTKTPAEAEKCAYGQFPRPLFNNSGAISALPSRRTDAE